MPVGTPLSNAIRALSMDAVQKANSGHPGAPMGMAEMALALFTRHLQHNPEHPEWVNRDRFVLSNGHASMLMYSVLHLCGYAVSMDDIRNFRQLHAITTGHPEVGVAPGVDTSTGPLGQGIANAVGFALAERLLAQEFNKPGHEIVDHFTYTFLGEGCLMEGISHEACALAGCLKLSRLIVLYDANGISIDGKVQPWFGENLAEHYRAYGWQVIEDINGHDVEAVSRAIEMAKSYKNNPEAGPTLIICKTDIGHGAPHLAGTSKVHGGPLGDEEIAAARQAMNWTYPPFEIPQDIYDAWSQKVRGAAAQAEWDMDFKRYEALFPEQAAEFLRRTQGELPADFTEKAAAALSHIVAASEKQATRRASQVAIEHLQTMLPELLGGSADLTSSNLTSWPNVKPVRPHQFGRHINYGVREFGMSAIMNGIALHGGYLPFGGTFLSFSDYARNGIRMSALMKQRVVYVFTHDSIGVGEDGPTHQPIEHAACLRYIPNLAVWRPCDTVETFVAWQCAVERPASLGMNVRDGGPTALLLSRQGLPFVTRTQSQMQGIRRGGYVLRDVEAPKAVIIATGSEVQLALQAHEALMAEGVPTRVVSMPSTTVFDQQSAEYQREVLLPGVPKVAVEAGLPDFWRKYVGLEGEVVGINRFGEGGPAGDLFPFFGITTEAVVDAVQRLLSK